MFEQLYKSAIKWKGEYCDVVHYTTSDFSHLPDKNIQKIHGVCFSDDKLLVVYHNEWGIWGIPGGTREEDEEILFTLSREIQEETACNLVYSNPIGYQEIKHSDGTNYYALFYYCEVKPDGEFNGDIAGSITAQEWINPEDYHKYIEQKPFRKIIIEDALNFRINKNKSNG